MLHGKFFRAGFSQELAWQGDGERVWHCNRWLWQKVVRWTASLPTLAVGWNPCALDPVPIPRQIAIIVGPLVGQDP